VLTAVQDNVICMCNTSVTLPGDYSYAYNEVRTLVLQRLL